MASVRVVVVVPGRITLRRTTQGSAWQGGGRIAMPNPPPKHSRH